MEALIKRFSQEAPLHTLVAIAFLGASLSIELSFLHATAQFITLSGILSLFTILAYFRFRKTFFNYYCALTISLIALLFNPFSGMAALFTISLFLFPASLIFRDYLLYTAALLSHVLDMLSTYLLLPDHSEANIVVRTLIERIGIARGLLLSKTLLIVLPLVYSYNYLEKGQQIIFVKFVFVLGLSMAFRNLIIYF